MLFAAATLVRFALTSPALPPENLISTLNEVAEYYTNPENSYFASMVTLPADESDWVALSVYSGDDEETGAGSQAADRTRDIEYQIRPGETLSGIATAYDIPFNLLAYYNNIANANRIRVGTVINIPSLENAKAAERRMAAQPRRAVAPAPVRTNTKSARIAFESRTEPTGGGLAVQFSVVDPLPDQFQSFEWDFGDGKRGFGASPSYHYSTPKTYVARLTARDTAGVIYKSNPLYIDIPYPTSVAERSTAKFITLSSPDEHFVVNGTITKVARYKTPADAPLDFSESDQFLTKVRFTKPGFYGLTVKDASNTEQYYSVFVSPIPTMHADAAPENSDWYRTQYNTGTTSNCGPASVSMAIAWALGDYFPVVSVRESIGWQGDGATSFEDLIKVIKAKNIPASIQPLRSVQNIKDVIDSGSIAIVLFRTDGVRTTRSDPATNLYDKYYNDTVGHYIVIKGYSLNEQYLVIHDPSPSDWGANSFRYGDELSMIGRNRYYQTPELLKSLRRADMIVVPRVIPIR
jgi:PKD repeat protein